jgi:hypothetical protein
MENRKLKMENLNPDTRVPPSSAACGWRASQHPRFRRMGFSPSICSAAGIQYLCQLAAKTDLIYPLKDNLKSDKLLHMNVTYFNFIPPKSIQRRAVR